MKKKLAMRIASFALCVIFTGMLFAAPKSKAVVAETVAVAVGTAVLATCLVSFGLSIQTDSGDTVGEGISSLVGDYLEYMAFDTTADNWLSEIANNTELVAPSQLLLYNLSKMDIAGFVDWLTETFGLDEDGKEAVAVPGIADYYLYNGVELPNIETFWDSSVYPYIILYTDSGYTSAYVSTSEFYYDYNGSGYNKNYLKSVSSGRFMRYSHSPSASVWTLDQESTSFSKNYTFCFFQPSASLWSNVSIFSDDDALVFPVNAPVPAGDVANQLELARQKGFANIALNALENDVLSVKTGLLSETLEEFAVDAPWAIAEGTFAPSAELTQTGEGTGEVNPPDDATVVPGVTPWLSSIFQGIKSIPDAIARAIAKIFTPSQEAVDNLASEVDTKLPFIPVLKDFGSDLVYNLEHPEACADGLGLTTVVDLGKGRGTYLGNTRHDLFDVTWYLEYKPLVDDLIVGFCWLVFLWNCYGALPRIIHGEGSTITVHAREFPAVGAGQNTKALGDGK